MPGFSAYRILIIALAVVALPAQAEQWVYENVPRVVALSDIHGAHETMVATLGQAGILDEQRAWAGDNAHLVIVGDILDRGPDSRQSMDLLMRLEAEAVAAGGRVHVLIGNHEAMVLTGDLRYVSRDEYAAFAADETAQERAGWFAQYDAKRNADAPEPEQRRRDFDTRYPPGYFAYRRAFATDGQYGRWLLEKPVMIVIDGTAFVHGGVSPIIAETGLDGINRLVSEQLQSYVTSIGTLTGAGLLLPTDSYLAYERFVRDFDADQATAAPVVEATEVMKAFSDTEAQALDGPLWYRGNVACNALIEIERLESALGKVGADRVVIGHTPTYGRLVLERFDGRVIEVDTGMLKSYYEGSGNALVIEGGQASVVTETGERKRPDPHPRRVGLRQEGIDASDLERILATGEILADRQDSFGRRFLTVSDGSTQIDGEFFGRAGRGFFPDLAAYRLDLLLGLDMVPVTVKRTIAGQDGSLQFLPPGTTDEARRRETGRGGSAWCPLPLQWDSMLVFDALIHNEARIATSIRYTETNWNLILAGHSRTFSTRKDRPNHLENVPLKVTQGWQNALEALDDELLEAELGAVVDARRLRALGARRDNLLELAATGDR